MNQSMLLNGKEVLPVKEREMIGKINQLTMPSSEVYKLHYKEKDNPREESSKKQYICDICRKCFQQVCQLKQHRRIHTGNFLLTEKASYCLYIWCFTYMRKSYCL